MLKVSILFSTCAGLKHRQRIARRIGINAMQLRVISSQIITKYTITMVEDSLA